jgi:hypothetical protein
MPRKPRRSRLDDSRAAPRLRRADLVWAPDPDCSYRRLLAFDATAGRYLPDRPPPDRPDHFYFRSPPGCSHAPVPGRLF